VPSAAAFPARQSWLPLLERGLAEDIGPGDATSNSVLPAGARLTCQLEAREDLIVCGLPIAEAAFSLVDPGVLFERHCADGEAVGKGFALARIAGDARAVLAAERTALNFMQRMCGIATETRRYVDAVAGTGTRIVDTRKTLPGWRALDKYAVRVGGGENHRIGLFDAVLIKDNHIAAAGGVVEAIRAARAGVPPHLWLQVEVESMDQAEAAVAEGVDSLLLDNRSVPELARFVQSYGARCTLEASGGVTFERIAEIAKTGVHRISIGALTHSVRAADVALEVQAAGAGA
jgi:nicotinate-nucleotide pyrophosphorylase (carboxylating)